MYYLYLIQGASGRAGFGICTNRAERNQQYASHSGCIVKFKYLYGGLRAHAKAMERTIKVELHDKLWMVDGWETEWLDSMTIEELNEYVQTIIKERHLRLSLSATDYDFTQDE